MSDADGDDPDGAGATRANAETDGEPVRAVVLDYLPRGRTENGRRSRHQSPVVLAVDVAAFALYESRLGEDADISIDDEIVLYPADERTDGVESVTALTYDDLTSGARAELEYVVEEIVTGDEGRFADFYNDAQPITLRLHQLNLLPGIGKKLRNNVLDARKRGPFEDFDDVEDRVSGLHDPRGILVERILEEIRDEDLKYRIFARDASREG